MSPSREMSRFLIPHVEEYYDRLRYESDPLGGYRLCGDQRLPHVTVNATGYRGAPWTGVETVLLLGDSVTFGVGASDDDARFAPYLAQALNQPVADASVRAYRVFQHYGRAPALFEQLPRLRHVVLWCGFADLLYWSISGGCIEGVFQFVQKYGARRQPRPVHAVLSALHATGSWLAAWAAHQRQPLPQRERGTIEQFVSVMMMYIRALHDLCAARHLEFVLLMQPFLREQPDRPELRAAVEYYDAKARAHRIAGWYETAPAFIHQWQAALAETASIRWRDCQSLVTEADFLDHVHLREQSVARLARALACDEDLWRSTRRHDLEGSLTP